MKQRNFFFFYGSLTISHSLREKCPYLELFWSAFPSIRAEYGEMLRISPYPIRMRENAEKNHSEYGHILRSDCIKGGREGQKLQF